MAYGVILKHLLEVDKISWGSFSKKKLELKKKKRGANGLFGGKEGHGCPFFNWCGEHCLILKNWKWQAFSYPQNKSNAMSSNASNRTLSMGKCQPHPSPLVFPRVFQW
jgi:hypothetical protein